MGEVYGGFAQILYLYVAEGFRRMHIAQKLISEMTERLRSGGVWETGVCVCLQGERLSSMEGLLFQLGFRLDETYRSWSVNLRDLGKMTETEPGIVEDKEHIVSIDRVNAGNELFDGRRDYRLESRVYLFDDEIRGGVLVSENGNGLLVSVIPRKNRGILERLFQETVRELLKNCKRSIALSMITSDPLEESFFRKICGEKIHRGPDIFCYSARLGENMNSDAEEDDEGIS